MDKPRKPRKSVRQTDSSENEASPTRLVTSGPSNKKKDQGNKLETGNRPETTVIDPNSKQDNKKKTQGVKENSRTSSTPRKRASAIAQKPEVGSKHNQAQPDSENSATIKRTSKKQCSIRNESVDEHSKIKTDSEDSAAEYRSSKKRGSIKDDRVDIGYPAKSPSSENSKDSNFVFQKVTSKPILKKEESEYIEKRSSSFKSVRLGQSFDLLSGEKYKAKNQDGFQMDKIMNDKREVRHEMGSSSRSPEVKSDPERRTSMRESHKNRITMVNSKIAEKKVIRRQPASNTSTASTVDQSGTEADVETIESEERTWDPETASCGGIIIKKLENTPEDIRVVLRESAKYNLIQIDSDSDSDADNSRRTRVRKLSTAHDILNRNIEDMTEQERKKHNMNLRKYKRKTRLAEEARAEAERKRLEADLKKYFLKEVVIDPKRPKKEKKVDKTKLLEDDYEGDESSSVEFSQSEIPDIVRDILETRAELYQALNQEKEHESEEEGPTNDDLMLEDHLKLQKEIAAAIERQKEQNASNKKLDHI